MTVSLDLDLLSAENVENPHPLFTRLRETAPVYQVPGTRFFLVSTWELVQEAVARTEDFSSALKNVLLMNDERQPVSHSIDAGGSFEQVLSTADGSIHKLHRGLVMKTLSKRIRALDEAVDAFAEGLWNSEVTGDKVDWVDAMADRLPLAMVNKVIGLPDEDLTQLLAWAYDSTEMLGGIVPGDRMTDLIEASISLYLYLNEKFAAAQQDPQDDLLGVLAEAVDAGEMTSDNAGLILVQLVGAGSESTAGLISNATRLLAERPDLQDRIRGDLQLLDPFLDECLRLEAPFRGHYRTVARDTELGGVALNEGDQLLLLWSAANRDPARFADPEVLDIERSGIRQHLAFGKGTHFCVGSALARMEATAALRILLERTENFSLDPDAPPTWVPSIFVRRHATLPLVLR